MSATPGRIACPRCGENNFDTQAACWKCASPLRGSPAASSRPVATPNVVSGSAAPASVYTAPTPTMDPAVAVWSAIALAVLFPYVAVPVGIVFLMLDDRRKAEIGRIALIWGIVATIVQTLFMFAVTQQSLKQAMVLMQAFGRGMPSASSTTGAGGNTDLNSSAEQLHLPGEINVPESGGAVTFPAVPPGVRQ